MADDMSFDEKQFNQRQSIEQNDQIKDFKNQDIDIQQTEQKLLASQQFETNEMNS